MLMLSGAADRIAPPPAVEFVATKARSEDKTFRPLGVAYGDSVDYGHGGLLVSREAPDEVIPIIEGWLAERATEDES